MSVVDAGSADLPGVEVDVELRAGIVRAEAAGPSGAALIAEVAAATTDAVTGICAALGIPVRPLVTVVELPAEDADRRPLITVRVGGVRCRFPETTPFAVAAALSGRWPERDPSGTALRDRALPDCSLPGLVAHVCAEAVRLQPSALLTPAAVRRYRAELVAAEPALAEVVDDEAWLAQVLAEVVDLGISVETVSGVAALLEERRPPTACDAVEDLVAELRPDSVGLLLTEDLWGELGVGDLTDSDDLRAFIAREVVETTGIVVPALVREDPAGLPPGTFAVRVNDLVGLPQLLLPPGTCLVTDDGTLVEAAGVSGQPAIDPMTDRLVVLADAVDRAALTAVDLATWTGAGYIAARLVTVLCQRAWRVVSQDLMVTQLDVLEEIYPVVVRCARAQLAPAPLTATLRALAASGVSLRDLVQVLERVADLPAAELGPDVFTVLADPVHSWTRPDSGWGFESDLEFLRAGLRHQIAQRLTSDSGVLVAYLLDSDLEDAIRRADRSEAVDDAVLAALDEEITHLPAGAQVPVLLTGPRVRPGLAELLRRSHPDLGVVSLPELPSTLAVQPIARIALRPEDG